MTSVAFNRWGLLAMEALLAHGHLLATTHLQRSFEGNSSRAIALRTPDTLVFAKLSWFRYSVCERLGTVSVAILAAPYLHRIPVQTDWTRKNAKQNDCLAFDVTP